MESIHRTALLNQRIEKLERKLRGLERSAKRRKKRPLKDDSEQESKLELPPDVKTFEERVSSIEESMDQLRRGTQYALRKARLGDKMLMAAVQNYSERMARNSDSTPMTIVTGADSSHYAPLLRAVFSILVYEPSAHLVVYDLGLREKEKLEFSQMFPGVEVRRFEYENYPDYFNIRVNQGQYAWKPTVIELMARETEGYLLWLDAGCLITGQLDYTRQELRETGLLTPGSGGNLEHWTHRKTLNWFKVTDTSAPNRSGGTVGVNTRHPEAMALIRAWADCAAIRECIAPKGSNRGNHRQDQAVLSILVAQSEFAAMTLHPDPVLLIHQDD